MHVTLHHWAMPCRRHFDRGWLRALDLDDLTPNFSRQPASFRRELEAARGRLAKTLDENISAMRRATD